MAPEQLQIRYDGLRADDADWAELLSCLRETISALGLKEVAFRLDVQPSELAHALAERDRHSVKAKWLPVIARMAKDKALAEFFAEIQGMEVQPAKPVTPEEELLALKGALEECLGAELRAAVIAKARAHRQQGRR